MWAALITLLATYYWQERSLNVFASLQYPMLISDEVEP